MFAFKKIFQLVFLCLSLQKLSVLNLFLICYRHIKLLLKPDGPFQKKRGMWTLAAIFPLKFQILWGSTTKRINIDAYCRTKILTLCLCLEMFTYILQRAEYGLMP